MEKAAGVPLSEIWSTMQLPQKLKILLAMTTLLKRCAGVTFSHYGSLYYATDVRPPADCHYVKNGEVVQGSEYVVGPTTARDWFDAGRSSLNAQRGPCTCRDVVVSMTLLTNQRVYYDAISTCSWSERDTSSTVSKAPEANRSVLWPGALSTRPGEEAHCSSMVPTDRRLSDPT
jgi:hypothetical protein